MSEKINKNEKIDDKRVVFSCPRSNWTIEGKGNSNAKTTTNDKKPSQPSTSRGEIRTVTRDRHNSMDKEPSQPSTSKGILKPVTRDRNTRTDKEPSQPSTSRGAYKTVTRDRNNRSEYAINKRWYAKAKYILQKSEESIHKGEGQSEAQEHSVEWAKNQIRIFETMREGMQQRQLVQDEQAAKPEQQAIGPENVDGGKRNRSAEESRTSKRLKSAEGKPYVPAKRTQARLPSQNRPPTTINRMPLSEVVKQHLKVSLIDTSKPDLRITPENFVIFDTKIVSQILKMKREGKINTMPAFDSSERYYGFKVITAESIGDLEVLKLIVSEMGEIWPGARIEVRNLADLPRPPKIMVTIPGEHKSSQDIVDVIEMSNTSMNLQGWRAINKLNPKEGRTVAILRINKESFEYLKREGMKINFGIHKVPVTVFETPANSPEDIMEEIIPYMESTKIDEEEATMDKASPDMAVVEAIEKNPSQ